MNAAALLASQGWRGKGHSLHKSSDDIGLANPLLLNRKSDKKGIGNTQHFTSDQWWMNAFDEQLAGLDTSKKGKVTQTIETGKINQFEKGSMAKYSLYSTFVSGGFLQGTIKTLDDEPTSTSDSDSDALEKSKKGTDNKESKEEKKVRKEAKRRRKEEKALIEALKASKKSKSDSSDEARELKKQRRAKKEEKRKQRRQKSSEK